MWRQCSGVEMIRLLKPAVKECVGIKKANWRIVPILSDAHDPQDDPPLDGRINPRDFAIRVISDLLAGCEREELETLTKLGADRQPNYLSEGKLQRNQTKLTKNIS